MSSPSLVIFRKELADALRSRLVLLMILGLGLVVVVSVVVAASAYHADLVDYQTYLDALKQAGGATPTAPLFFPLQLLRGTVEYLEIIGSIVAVVIGYGVIAKEKNRGTLRLLFSRPVNGTSIAAGKLLALATIWLSVVVALGAVMVVSICFVGGASLSAVESEKLLIALGLSWVYLFTWSALAMGLAGLTRQLGTALVVGLVLWLGLVLIVPQVGDTMDPDNQVPGGLFSSLQVDKPHEKAVMARFTGYERTRNLLETMSISKRYERASFAYLGVKDNYNQRPLGSITRSMWTNTGWLVSGAVLAVGLAVTQTSKQKLLRKA